MYCSPVRLCLFLCYKELNPGPWACKAHTLSTSEIYPWPFCPFVNADIIIIILYTQSGNTVKRFADLLYYWTHTKHQCLTSNWLMCFSPSVISPCYSFTSSCKIVLNIVLSDTVMCLTVCLHEQNTAQYWLLLSSVKTVFYCSSVLGLAFTLNTILPRFTLLSIAEIRVFYLLSDTPFYHVLHNLFFPFLHQWVLRLLWVYCCY